MSETIFFYIFASISVIMVTSMILQKNPVASAMCLVFAFFGLAGLYVLLSAPFVAILQVLVYAGAIMVLFVFVIMLLKLQPEDLVQDQVTWKKTGYILFGLVFLFFLVTGLMSIVSAPFQGVPVGFGEAKAVGRLMFTKYLLPFELASILILIAIIGAVLLGKKEERK